MDAVGLIQQLRSELAAAQAAGRDTVPVSEFERWLADLEEIADKDPQLFHTVVMERSDLLTSGEAC